MSPSIPETADLFKAMGDETRLKIVKLIASRGNKLCVGAIVHHLDVSQPAVSQHLKVLKNAGLVKSEKEGYHMHYSLDGDAFNPYGIDFLTFLKSFGAELDLKRCCENKGKDKKCGELN